MEIRCPQPDFLDNRGSITDLFYDDQINHVTHIKTTDIEAVRGNHYHKETTQAMYMIKGSLLYWSKPLNSDKVQCRRISKGEIVTTPPNEIHALTFDELNEFIVFTWGKRGGKDYESDTFRVDSIVNMSSELS